VTPPSTLAAALAALLTLSALVGLTLALVAMATLGETI